MTAHPASGPGAAGLCVEGVSKAFGSRKALDRVSLSVAPGEIVALLGPNGSGKSTLFNILTGIEPADAGHITIDGVEVTGLPAFGRARLGIGYLPQDPSSFRGLSLRDNLALVLEGRIPDRRLRATRVEALLAAFGLGDCAARKPGALSGGQRRRAELARALACAPRYLLVDEPFAKLDPLHIEGFADMLRRLAPTACRTAPDGTREAAPGILITDHNIRATLTLATRAVILVSGVVIADGPADRVLRDPAIRDAILSPDTVL